MPVQVLVTTVKMTRVRSKAGRPFPATAYTKKLWPRCEDCLTGQNAKC